MDGLSHLAFQVKLMLEKRYIEVVQYRSEMIKLLIFPMGFVSLCILLYAVFPLFRPGGAEPFIIPIGFWVFIQRIVVLIVYEKSQKLQEALKMMGMTQSAYYTSYFLSEGLISGFFISIACACLSLAHANDGDLGYPLYGDHHLFNNGSFGDIFSLFFCFCLAAPAFAFFLACFFDSPQNAGQGTFLLLLLFYVIFVGVKSISDSTITHGTVLFLCLFPPFGLQFGCKSFLPSYQYNNLPNISQICGMMIIGIFVFMILTWYLSNVIPSEIGVAKPWYFPLTVSYWTSNRSARDSARNTALGLEMQNSNPIIGKAALMESVAGLEAPPVPKKAIVEEKVDETLQGRATVDIRNLRKSFDGNVAVDGVSMRMYENQIFALLGHNGAGKTTTINMLTGLFEPDNGSDTQAYIYNQSIFDQMDDIRKNLGYCPQHDVLFEKLSVREHILLAAQLKGSTLEQANKEADELTKFFHLDQRLDHKGSELSGGQKRKLSVALAVCGGSKFIVLDEPTAGMDPLARREFWDLLTKLRKGRTMLLTTHYMDEADVLGDRVGIMNLGVLQCIGSTKFLKREFGAGYKLCLEKGANFTNKNLNALSELVTKYISEAKFYEDIAADNQVSYTIPFTSVSKFADFFENLSANLSSLNVVSYGIMLTSLEDVFLKVGEDRSVTPKQETNKVGIGSDNSYSATFLGQTVGIMFRRLKYALHDVVTIPMLFIPIAVFIVAAVLDQLDVVSKEAVYKDLTSCGLYYFAFLVIPGLIAEFLVRERSNRLRTVLTVMGCDQKAYWLGNVIADFLLMLVPTITLFITWDAVGMSDFNKNKDGLAYFVFILFIFQMIGFSYVCSYLFTSPVKCMIFMPVFILLLLVLPMIIVAIYAVITIQENGGPTFTSGHHGPYNYTYFDNSTGFNNTVTYYNDDFNRDDDGALTATPGYIQWGVMMLSPQGALFCAFLDISVDLSSFIDSFPKVGQTIAFMVSEAIVFFGLAYYFDSLTIQKEKAEMQEAFDQSKLDSDVIEERNRVAATIEQTKTNGWTTSSPSLVVNGLRKAFPGKKKDMAEVVAVDNVSFQVEHNEIFGLLGANGAGKTTTLSIITRHILPSFGDAFVTGYSVLSDFAKASSQLGVVTQNNSLWDLLSVQDHLYLFARLRGVPENIVKTVVENTIDQLQLTPHRNKLACRLSGGMKRKLCVAIALIGDPAVVLLDEPSAGLDPVSRRNLWNVILNTMSHRAVVLTTHSMEEAEALCKRIGIMVKGQIRAIGTKQHLKSKFSSGYEVSVKLEPTSAAHLDECLVRFDTFIKGVFSQASVIATNSALVTYRVPKEQMDVALAFRSFEAHKAELFVADYSVSQPTLEQVFISTVVENSGDELVRSMSLTGVARQSTKMDLETFLPLKDSNPDHHDDGEHPDANTKTANSAQPGAKSQDCMQSTCCPDEDQKLLCGCQAGKFHYALYASWVVFVILFIVNFLNKTVPNAVRLMSTIFLVLSLGLCCVGCCPCFRKKADDE